jgi:hypothetical protein
MDFKPLVTASFSAFVVMADGLGKLFPLLRG